MNKCKLNYCLKEKSAKETGFPENKNFLVYLLKKLSNKKRCQQIFSFAKKTMKGWASTRANYKGIFFENSAFVKFFFVVVVIIRFICVRPSIYVKGGKKCATDHTPQKVIVACLWAPCSLSLSQLNRIASLPLFVYFLVKKRELLLPLSLHSSFHTVTDVGRPVVDTIVMYVVLVLSTLRIIFTFPRHAFGKIICMLKHQL